MCLEGLRWIESCSGNRDIFEIHEKELKEKQIIEYLLSNVENVLINGTQLILNQVFKIVGFDEIEEFTSNFGKNTSEIDFGKSN